MERITASHRRVVRRAGLYGPGLSSGQAGLNFKKRLVRSSFFSSK